MNNYYVFKDLTYTVLHIFYSNIHIFILVTSFNYGYGIDKDNIPEDRKHIDDVKIDLHPNESNLGIKSTMSTSDLLVNGTNETANSNHFFPWPSKFNTTVTGFYLLAALSAAIILYFVIKALRLRRRRSKVRRYGILASREDVEMTPLGDEDEDEDSTVFDINEHCQS